ncbi:enhancer of split malpha protein [Stomoxys calcitrans]|uniref:enhancer of split malpha protein n=1 Tax=Stomoxys calcitrans TaxID=35570 RepID=UPI0027E2F415|nr:enhancer of split malpha protein [Stomoxys calcitrans]
MCQQMENNNVVANNKMKTNSYSIKKVLKTFFKKHHKQQQHEQQAPMCHSDNCSTSTGYSSYSSTSYEDLENYRNMQAEHQQYFNEIDDNAANEKLADMCCENEDEDIYVPVRFARTEAGTFFWTTNLQPVTSTITPAVDEDLVQPAYCYSNYQYPLMQFQDRWAQA